MSFYHMHCGGKHDKISQARECESNPNTELPSDQSVSRDNNQIVHKKPSPAMLRKIRAMLRYRNIPAAYAEKVQEFLDQDKFSFIGAMRTIDRLKEFPERANFNQPDQHPTSQADLKEGVYRNPDTGEYWVARHRINEPNSPLNACIVIIREQPVCDPQTKKIIQPAKIGFEYVRGGIRTLHPSWRLTEEQAKEFGDLYGSCIKCGSELTKETSIARGMGDTCAGKQWG